jgi:hypothetical protein
MVSLDVVLFCRFRKSCEMPSSSGLSPLPGPSQAHLWGKKPGHQQQMQLAHQHKRNVLQQLHKQCMCMYLFYFSAAVALQPVCFREEGKAAQQQSQSVEQKVEIHVKQTGHQGECAMSDIPYWSWPVLFADRRV